MHDPGKDAGRHHVRAPGDLVPGGIVGEPAPHQRARRVAGAGADAHQVAEPAEAVPGGKPSRPRLGGKPDRRRIAHQLARQLDRAGEDRLSACRLARPALAHPHAQIGGREADQRVAIERRGGERLQRPAAQPRHRVGGVGIAASAPAANLPAPRNRRGLHPVS
jgi:hypothetical protein